MRKYLIPYLVLLLALSAAPLAKAEIAGSSLVGLWTLDGSRISGTTVTDSSGQGNNGTTSGSPTVTGGKMMQGLNFVAASSQYVTVVNGVAAASTPTAFKTIANANSYSFSAWIKTSTSVAAPFNWSCGQNIIEARNSNPGSGSMHGWAFGINSTKLCAARTSNYTTTAEIKNSSATVNDGKWHFVVATVNVNAVTFYIDGKQDSTATYSVATGDCSVGGASNTVYLRIGARTIDAGTAATFSTAVFDDIRVYNVALSANDVSALYYAGAGAYGGL